jgi:hypothetical protein
MTWGLLTLEPLGKAQEFAQLIKVLVMHSNYHPAIFQQLMGAFQKGNFISGL